MSTDLYYRPFIRKDGKDLSYELKKAIAPKYYDHDGSLGGNWLVLDSDEIPYLEGIRDGGIKDAQELIDAINKYGAVEIALLS